MEKTVEAEPSKLIPAKLREEFDEESLDLAAITEA